MRNREIYTDLNKRNKRDFTMNVKEKLEKIRSHELSAEENVKKFIEKIKKEDKRINSFLYLAEKEAIQQAKEVDKKIKAGHGGKLAGLAIAIKSNINVSGLPATCGSNTLKDYIGTYDADVIERIKKEDGIIIGMLNMDEFACGSSGESSAFGPTDNPAALGKIPGGSSSGSAASVAAEFCDISLGSDTGGSIRCPASHCGVVGVKPSYGRVSRYGLIDLSMSLDQIGPLTNDVYANALMMEVISGHSNNDTITYDKEVDRYTDFSQRKKLRIGLVVEFEKMCDPRIYIKIKSAAEKIAKETDSEIKFIELKNVDLAIQTYYPLVYVEFYSGTRKFDGRRYGSKIEDSCGEEVLRRILGGQEISKAEYHGTYYRKALAVKKLIQKDFHDAFQQVDVILTPTVPKLPHIIGSKISTKEMYAYDAYTIPANLAGICAGVLPAGKVEGIPVGLQVMANSFNEKLMYDVMKTAEELMKR